MNGQPVSQRQVQVISLSGLGPDAYVARCRCGWGASRRSKPALIDELTAHLELSVRCRRRCLAQGPEAAGQAQGGTGNDNDDP